MKVSIITSCYNCERTIRGAIESVLSQDYPNIEYIIIDGASTDHSAQIIRETIAGHEEKVKFVSEPDHGMYEAINKGIRMATGDVIALCHSDDFIFNSKTVSHIVKKMKETDCDFLYADGIFVNETNTNKVVRKWISGNYARWKVRCGWLPMHPTCYIKREVMMRCGLYDESYTIAADTKLLVDYLYNYNLKIAYLPEFVIRMRMGGMSTDPVKRKKMWDEDVRIYTHFGFKPAALTKLMKMTWKIPQFVKAKFM